MTDQELFQIQCRITALENLARIFLAAFAKAAPQHHQLLKQSLVRLQIESRTSAFPGVAPERAKALNEEYQKAASGLASFLEGAIQ